MLPLARQAFPASPCHQCPSFASKHLQATPGESGGCSCSGRLSTANTQVTKVHSKLCWPPFLPQSCTCVSRHGNHPGKTQFPTLGVRPFPVSSTTPPVPLSLLPGSHNLGCNLGDGRDWQKPESKRCIPEETAMARPSALPCTSAGPVGLTGLQTVMLLIMKSILLLN